LSTAVLQLSINRQRFPVLFPEKNEYVRMQQISCTEEKGKDREELLSSFSRSFT